MDKVIKYIINKLILLLFALVLASVCDILNVYDDRWINIINGIFAFICLGIIGHLFILEPIRKLYKLYKWTRS